jgi:hypothetical protein
VLSSRSPHLARSRGLIALIVGIMVLASIFQTNVGHALLRTAGLSQGSDGYTSLSFLGAQSLPEQLQSKQTKVRASFVIRNATDATHDYAWSISLIRNGRTDRVYTGNVSLTAAREAEITRSVAIKCSHGQIRMDVSLEDPVESISSLMACRP